MKALTTSVPRIVLGVVMAIFGIFHFMAGSNMAGIVPSFLPFPIVWVYLTGLALVAAGLSFIANIKAKLAGLLLALMLILFALLIHLPGLSNPDMAQMAMPNFLKDVGLAMGALLVSGVGKK